jgi:hypothetical protein
MSSSMSDIARLVQTLDDELRQELKSSRSGIFRNSAGELYVRSNVPLGQRYTEEMIGIFADSADLDFFYKIYLKENG